MDWQYTPYLIPLVLAGGLSVVLAFFAVRQWGKRTAPQIVGILVGAAIWAFTDALRIASGDLGTKLLFQDLRFFGSTTLVLATILFAVEYTGRERWMRRRHVAALAAPFVVTLLLVVTTRPLGHEWMRSGADLVTVAGLQLLDVEFGPWFWINATYSYFLLVAALSFYVVELRRGQSGTYRRQTIVIAISLLIPWILNGLFLAEVTLVDLTAVGLAVTGLMYYVAIFWFELLELVPIARSTIVDHIDHGVMVLDPDGRIVDANEAMGSMLGASRPDLIGRHADAVETDAPEILEAIGGEGPTEDLSIAIDGAVRHFEIETSPVYSDTDRHLGRVVLLRDVTRERQRAQTLRERTARLEQQNEQLDRFADVVSHDLRNPINVANGYLELAAEDPDPEHFEKIDTALDRMEEIVDDVLALARHSRDLDATEPVDLAAVASDAWNTVEAPDASIDLQAAGQIEADRSRLQQFFENLFRNAVEHGPSDVTITVGDTADGFFVEDDGPGIPADQREEVFEHGYSTETDGTGFGLSIVAAIADTHRWSIRVREGTAGGARFEIVTDDPARDPGDRGSAGRDAERTAGTD